MGGDAKMMQSGNLQSLFGNVGGAPAGGGFPQATMPQTAGLPATPSLPNTPLGPKPMRRSRMTNLGEVFLNPDNQISQLDGPWGPGALEGLIHSLGGSSEDYNIGPSNRWSGANANGLPTAFPTQAQLLARAINAKYGG